MHPKLQRALREATGEPTAIAHNETSLAGPDGTKTVRLTLWASGKSLELYTNVFFRPARRNGDHGRMELAGHTFRPDYRLIRDTMKEYDLWKEGGKRFARTWIDADGKARPLEDIIADYEESLESVSPLKVVMNALQSAGLEVEDYTVTIDGTDYRVSLD